MVRSVLEVDNRRVPTEGRDGRELTGLTGDVEVPRGADRQTGFVRVDRERDGRERHGDGGVGGSVDRESPARARRPVLPVGGGGVRVTRGGQRNRDCGAGTAVDGRELWGLPRDVDVPCRTAGESRFVELLGGRWRERRDRGDRSRTPEIVVDVESL